jgi:hypothetical protein
MALPVTKKNPDANAINFIVVLQKTAQYATTAETLPKGN